MRSVGVRLDRVLVASISVCLQMHLSRAQRFSLGPIRRKWGLPSTGCAPSECPESPWFARIMRFEAESKANRQGRDEAFEQIVQSILIDS